MGEVIAFKPVKEGAPMRPPAATSAKIMIFTGGAYASMNGQVGNRTPDREKAAWYERCRIKFSRCLGPLLAWLTASLRAAGHCPGDAEQATRLGPWTIPGQAKRKSLSSMS
jgi:hypothetical protein